MKQYFDLFFKLLDFVYETNSQVAFYKKVFMQYMQINDMEFIPENDLDFLVAMAERIFPFLITLKMTESSEYYDDEAMFKLYSEVWEKTASDMDSVDEYGGSYFTASDKAAQQHFLKFVETNDELKDIFSGTSKDIELILKDSKEDFPTSLEQVKAVYISEDKEAWKEYVNIPKLESYRPVAVYVYTHHTLPVSGKGTRVTHFDGYAPPAHFVMPDYSVMPPEEDFRRTLYWNPNLTTDENGKAMIVFYNNATCKQLRVSAEGISPEGNAIICR